MTQKEFENTIAGLRTKLLKMAKRFVWSSAADIDAEDIVQDTLLSLWQLYDQGYPIQNPEPLAVKILKTKCIAEFRKDKPTIQTLEGVEQEGGESASISIDTQEANALEESLLKHLTETQRELIELRSQQGLSLDEISIITGKPKTSVKSTISSARKIMLDLLKKV